MKTLRSRVSLGFAAAFLAVSMATAGVAEARIGGGRSSGFRGSRGFGTRSATTSSPYRSQSPYQQNYQQTTPPPASPMGTMGNANPSSGAFTRGLLGGLAGGMIGSMLFRNFGHAGGMGGLGGGGIGLFEILLLLGAGYMAYRFFAGRRHAMAGQAGHSAYREMSHVEKLRSVEPGPYAQNGASAESACAATLQRYDTSFDLATFKDERMDAFLKLQAAWSQRDVSSLSGYVGPELLRQLDSDIDQLKAEGRINRIEQIAVRGTELIEAWQEYGKEFATLRFRANLVDYTIDERTSQVVAGDRNQSVKFEEDWTFVREVDRPRESNPWKLTSIEA